MYPTVIYSNFEFTKNIAATSFSNFALLICTPKLICEHCTIIPTRAKIALHRIILFSGLISTYVCEEKKQQNHKKSFLLIQNREKYSIYVAPYNFSLWNLC